MVWREEGKGGKRRKSKQFQARLSSSNGNLMWWQDTRGISPGLKLLDKQSVRASEQTLYRRRGRRGSAGGIYLEFIS